MDAATQNLNLSLDKLNEADKAELQTFLSHTEQRHMIQARTHQLTNTCWKKCVAPNNIKNNQLDRGEQQCLTNCVERFFDMNKLTVNHLNTMQQR